MADSVALRPASPYPECFRPLQRLREGHDRKVFFGRRGAQQPGHLAASPDQMPILRRPSLYLTWSAAVLGTDDWCDTGGYRVLMPEPIRARYADAEQDRTDPLAPYFGSRNYRAASVARRVTTAMRPEAPNTIIGANAGGPPQLPIRTRWAARMAQFSRLMACMVWLPVRIHLMNQNAYLACGEDVGVALPTRATRDPNERQPHRLDQPFNPRPAVARQPKGLGVTATVMRK
jgi:hypothetical protein